MSKFFKKYPKLKRLHHLLWDISAILTILFVLLLMRFPYSYFCCYSLIFFFVLDVIFSMTDPFQITPEKYWERYFAGPPLMTPEEAKDVEEYLNSLDLDSPPPQKSKKKKR